MRSAGVVMVAVLSAGLLGCGSEQPDPQRLIATGQLVTSDTGTPLAGKVVDRYQLAFVVAGENGEVSIERAYSQTDEGAAIMTDADGRFQITSDDLALAYDWERDELVCEDVCTAWETTCETVTEEVCASVCTDVECYDECSTECWDETTCDENGDCWTETYCDDVCTTVCEEVSYDCDCQLESYEVCGDECVELTQECGWVTRYYTSPAELSQVLDTQADIWMRNESGTQVVTGETLEARQHESCDREGKCSPVNLWVQKDRFVIP